MQSIFVMSSSDNFRRDVTPTNIHHTANDLDHLIDAFFRLEPEDKEEFIRVIAKDFFCYGQFPVCVGGNHRNTKEPIQNQEAVPLNAKTIPIILAAIGDFLEQELIEKQWHLHQPEP